VGDSRAWLGVISDTHGLLRPGALDALRGALHIIHAGDVGHPEILDRLRTIAPVTVVRGNIDRDEWAAPWPEHAVLTFAERSIYVLHDLNALEIDPVREGHAAVISGHSHAPRIDVRRGVLYLNPGSAGPKRFSLPITVARVWLEGAVLRAEIVDLTGQSHRRPAVRSP
jgi:putative phosphoesterase